MLSNDLKLREAISEMEADLSAYKAAYASAQRDNHELKVKLSQLNQDAEKERLDLQSQLRVRHGET